MAVEKKLPEEMTVETTEPQEKNEVLTKPKQQVNQVVNFDGSDLGDDDWDEDSDAADSEEPADGEDFEFDDDWDAL